MQAIQIEDGVPLPKEAELPTIPAVMRRWNCSRSLIHTLDKRGEIDIIHIGIGKSGARVVGVEQYEQRRLAEARQRKISEQQA